MLSLITLVVTSVFASVAVAQAPNATFPPSTITQVTGEVDLTTLSKSYLSVLRWACPFPRSHSTDDRTLDSWCTSQHSTCGTLCGGTTDSNNCDGVSIFTPPFPSPHPSTLVIPLPSSPHHHQHPANLPFPLLLEKSELQLHLLLQPLRPS